MTQVVTIVDITIPAFAPNSPAEMQTFRFIDDTINLPAGTIIPGFTGIPSIKSVKITPGIISLGENLGTRSTIEVIFRDHKHVFAGESYESGTFWGKFRARYGLKLRGSALALYRVPFVDVTVLPFDGRHYIIETTDGPSADGEYRIIAKDVLKYADGDRSQCPPPAQGYLAGNITVGATSASLSPTGIGATYPASGYLNISGKEVVSFTRSGDSLTISAAQVAHNGGDRVQHIAVWTATSVANIIYDLLVNYADVPASYITLANWQAEVNTYLNTVYSAAIAEPTAVNDLVSELIEQAGLLMWWDDINAQIRLQVLRTISTASATFNADNILAGSLRVSEQPDKRLSQVYVYFAKQNPLINHDQIDNYLGSAYAADLAGEAAYGSSMIRKIYSRWIPAGGRAVADLLCNTLLTRFATPPRRINCSMLRSSITTPSPGLGYVVQGWPFQHLQGSPDSVPVQLISLNPHEDIFECEFEEVFGGALPGGGSSPNNHVIIIDSSLQNANLLVIHNSIYTTAVSGDTVTVTINAGVTISSSHYINPAFDVGSGWAAGVTIDITNLGLIEGAGGSGGHGADNTMVAQVGTSGGTALYTRQAITLHNAAGYIWGGGGGGGGGGSSNPFGGAGGGGGGGAGIVQGTGGAGGVQNPAYGGTNGGPGQTGTYDAGGIGGAGGHSSGGGPDGGAGGTGGGPGVTGNVGANGATAAGASGGPGGYAVDGNSYITFVGGAGSIAGGQVN